MFAIEENCMSESYCRSLCVSRGICVRRFVVFLFKDLVLFLPLSLQRIMSLEGSYVMWR